MEETAKRDAVRRARLVRHTTRMQVLCDILKSTSDSLKSLVDSAADDGGIDAVVRAITTPPIPSRPQDPDPEPDLPTDRCVCGHPRGTHGIDGMCNSCNSCNAFRWFGVPPAANTRSAQHPHDPLFRRTVTRGTVRGLLDRLDDALDRDEKLNAQAAVNELRHLVDDLPL